MKLNLFILMMCFKHLCLSQNCQLPIISDFSDITATGFHISWIDFNGTQEGYEIEFGIKGFSRTLDPNVQNIDDNFYNFVNLESGTTYEIYLRTVCDVNNKSDWNGPYFINTIIKNEDNCNLSLEITDNNCPLKNEFLIEVKDYPDKTIGSDINLDFVSLSIFHTWPPDLLIELESPSGKSAILSSHNGNGVDDYGAPNSNCDENAIFNDNACLSIEEWSPPFIGSFKSEDELNLAFNGEVVNGIWKLNICDRAQGDIGQLTHINLSFSQEKCQPPQDFIISDIEGTNATFEWNAFDNCANLNLTYKAVGASNQDVFVDIVDCSFQKFIATELDPNTQYELIVNVDCLDGSSSEPLCVLYFETRCQDNSFVETFDSLELCSSHCDSTCQFISIWQNTNDSEKNWLINANNSNSDFTGPRSDKNGRGNYLHFESSISCGLENTAILSSDCISINSSGDCALSFYYHMFGDEVGSLFLEMTTDDSNWDIIWEMTGNQGNEWIFESVNILQDISKGRLRFRTQSQPGITRGDIAIDHIKLYNTNAVELSTYYFDFDKDGFGDRDSTILICSDKTIEGFVQNDQDCNDNNALINPQASEVACNLEDDNCNGQIDEVQSSLVALDILLVQDETCKGSNDGSIEIVLALGTPPFEYFWEDGTIGSKINNLESGVYFCTISDGNGCQNLSMPIVVGFDDIIVYNVEEITNTSCNGANDGSIALNIDGGTEPYNVQWSNGQEGQIISDLMNGSYYATITSENGCQLVTDEIIVTGNQILTTGVAIKNDIDCAGDSTGFIQLGIVGGLPAYDIRWSNGDTTNFINQLIAGTYHVTIEDKNGCVDVISDINIFEPELLTPSINNIGNISCFGERDGIIDLNITGGTPPYSYFWSNGTFTQDQFNISAGIYDVTINDFKACSTILSDIEINQPDNFNVSIDTISSVACSGSSEGIIRVDVTGGTLPYTYNWSNADGIDATDNFISNLFPGQYFLTVVDALGCKSLPGKFEVNNQNIPIEVDIAILDSLLCFNDTIASVIANSGSQKFPIDFNWSTGTKLIKNVISDTIFALPSGNFNVTVTDNEGCVGISDFINIRNPNEIEYEVNEKTNNLCFDESLGTIQLLAFGGTGNLKYNWNTGQDIPTITNLINGNYICTLTDINECVIVTDSIIIDSPSELTISTVVSHQSNSNLGTITLDIQGGTKPYSIKWPAPYQNNSSAELNGLISGEYSVTVTDSNDCEKEINITVDFISSITSIDLDKKFSVYPNPAYDYLNVINRSNEELVQYSIINNFGNIVQKSFFKNGNQIDISNLNTGLYYLKLHSHNNEVVLKIIVLH